MNMFIRSSLRNSYESNLLVEVSSFGTSRGIGKSTSLVEFAIEKDVPIIVTNHFHKNRLKEIYKHVDIVVMSDLVRGCSLIRSKRGLLFEEGFSMFEIEDIIQEYPNIEKYTGYITK